MVLGGAISASLISAVLPKMLKLMSRSRLVLSGTMGCGVPTKLGLKALSSCSFLLLAQGFDSRSQPPRLATRNVSPWNFD